MGVINQTTQLASDTQAIAEYLKEVMIEQFGLTTDSVQDRFADTRDTLCYATNDNQTAVKGMLDTAADLAIVVGGFNSSNTTHLVEILEARFPTYFINDEAGILNESVIRSFNIHTKAVSELPDFLPAKTPVKILLTSGASCPDAIVERVIERLLEVKGVKIELEIFAKELFK
jgi:4-hydroxy-3-methylbut-2-enyl diphosphate reductase